MLVLVTNACGGPSGEPVCTPACAPGFACGPSGCVPTMADGPARDLSVGGDLALPCGGSCTGATPHCNAEGACVPCLDDAHCPGGQICRKFGRVAGCVPGCADDSRCAGGSMKCCGGGCVDTSVDSEHCGACGMACAAPHAAGRCEGGQCKAGSCHLGWGDCNMDPSDGCETNLRIDTANCMACGVACAPANGTGACSNYCYIAQCDYGWDDCNIDVKDGCEVPTLSDVRNCGGCGKACGAVPHAQIACAAGRCILQACSAGFGDCNGNSVDGCEITLANDRFNCGKCGLTCAPGLICVNGDCTCAPCGFPNAKSACVDKKCVIASCNTGYGDCDNVLQNGCETGIASNVNNCGGCGVVCAQGLVCVNGSCTCPQCNIPNARSKCVNFMCAFDQCLPDYADCNNNVQDGCEVNIGTDAKNCGACGKLCQQGFFCVAGACINVPLTLLTDVSWKQTLNAPFGWEQPGFNDGNWSASVDEGANGTAPWGNLVPLNGSQARWIWYYDSRNGGDNSVVYFRKAFTAVQANMTLVMTADNIYTVYLDGVQAAQSNDVWSTVHSFNIVLTPGKQYVMAVMVTNQGGPGGLIIDMH